MGRYAILAPWLHSTPGRLSETGKAAPVDRNKVARSRRPGTFSLRANVPPRHRRFGFGHNAPIAAVQTSDPAPRKRSFMGAANGWVEWEAAFGRARTSPLAMSDAAMRIISEGQRKKSGT